ncbi:hypothetical protein BDQ17DRAFT_1420241 [Cyathus striatus]|nr:hypothetical protein BDQ17DRAFT_1420241 [Cyathus striatus]
MFKFDFDIDDIANDDELAAVLLPASSSSNEPAATTPSEQNNLQPFTELSLSTLLDALPHVISYSPILISLSTSPSTDKRTLALARRDLYDARFQLIAEGADETNQDKDDAKSTALEFIQAPSDLVPGVYEGGLKTWECSLDLVNYLEGAGKVGEWWTGKGVLELGCGTAVPSLYILRELFSRPSPAAGYPESQIHLQDYNSSVIELLTLPNITLAWYTSPAAQPYLSTLPPSDEDEEQGQDMNITPELKSAFLNSLKEHNVTLRFSSGAWEFFNPQQTYNVVLTSETIYRTESLPAIIKALSSASGDGLDTLAERKLSIQESEAGKKEEGYICLVAAKVLYFGVGGGVAEFVDSVESGSAGRKGTIECVWERKEGVGRRILSVKWD